MITRDFHYRHSMPQNFFYFKTYFCLIWLSRITICWAYCFWKQSHGSDMWISDHTPKQSLFTVGSDSAAIIWSLYRVPSLISYYTDWVIVALFGLSGIWKLYQACHWHPFKALILHRGTNESWVEAPFCPSTINYAFVFYIMK